MPWMTSERGFTGAERALLVCFGLAIVTLVGALLRGGSEEAAASASRVLAAGAGEVSQIRAVVRPAAAVRQVRPVGAVMAAGPLRSPGAFAWRTGPKQGPPVYDGSGPAPGTTDTNAAQPVDPPVRGDPGRPDRATYDNVINQFGVETNPRYEPRDSSGDGFTDTFCNIFVWDVTSAMGAEIPHWVDPITGAPVAPGYGIELNANATQDWLEDHGAEYGWYPVDAEAAQDAANRGQPAVVSWKNNGGIGHIAVVRPGDLTEAGPAIAQAGADNLNDAHVRDTFGRAPVQYWVHRPRQQ